MNSEGTLFVEISEDVGGLSEIVPRVMREHGTSHMVVIDPRWVHLGYWVRDTPTYNRYLWTPFWTMAHDWAGMSLADMTYLRSEGARLNPENFTELRSTIRARVRSGSMSSGSAAGTPSDGCVSSSSTSGSSMSCYTGGRLTYRVVCSSNPRTFEVNCRSDSY